MNEIKLKRVYENPEPEDGYRILVDRLWPRGIKKEELAYDYWAKEITPSTHIRREFNHEAEKFQQFRTDYLNELAENDEAIQFVGRVQKELNKQNVTLLYAAKDPNINHVVILKAWLEGQK